MPYRSVPLTRENVTIASRIMLPAYTILTLGFGIVYVWNPQHRLDNAPALTFPRAVMGGSMAPWGAVFLSLAGLMCYAFWRGKRGSGRTTFAFGLCMCAVSFFLWGCLYCVSVCIDPMASFTAPFYPWFVSTACIASTASLLKGEVTYARHNR